MKPVPGDLVIVYDARDLYGSPPSLGVGVYLYIKDMSPGDLFAEVGVLMGGKVSRGPYAVTVIQNVLKAS